MRLSQLRQFDYVIVESSGISEPEQVAETFDARLAETMSALVEQGGLDASVLGVLRILKDNGGLAAFARLDTTATVIDAFTIMNDFDTEDMLSARRDDVAAEDERTVSDLMVDQIEFADVIILNKTDMVSYGGAPSPTQDPRSASPRMGILILSPGGCQNAQEGPNAHQETQPSSQGSGDELRKD